jgi:predicted dehydrogenase
MCERDDLDVVVTATPWQWHTPICVAAMKAGKHCATEVPAALSLDECWQLVETSEKTGKHCMMLEQVNYSREVLRLMRMAQQGVFGQILHAAGGYVHDLRLVKSDPEREPWRMQFEFLHNGNLYPTHPIGPIAWWLDIHHGDRFETLVSMSSKAVCNKEYTAIYYGDRHPYLSMDFSQGDSNTTLISTSGGKTVTLHYDTNTPHPHTGEMRLQGTKGLYVGNLRKGYIEGRSPKPHEWEPFGEHYAEFEHPLWQGLDPNKYKTARGHGGGSDAALMWERYFRAIATGVEPDMTVYDAAAWSAIIPLSGRSVSGNGRPVEIPDFTRGKWKAAPPVQLA